ncbi:MAG TPA: hypothetical protein VKP60_01585 [Magnetospirillaceae bacterium]|nr:hypothetical protein [Magnetospirillaceae bacterium]
MVDLKKITDKINGDPAEAKKFQEDPVAYLEAEGLHLPEDAKKQLRDNVKAHAANNPVWNVGVIMGPKS